MTPYLFKSSILQLAALDGIIEILALDRGNLKLQSRGLAGAISTSKGASAPGRATVDLVQS